MTAWSDLPDLSWMNAAACTGVDPDLFFPERGASTREAKETCAACPVRQECLDYAIDNGEKFGIWGGLSEKQRRPVRKQNGRIANAGNAAGQRVRSQPLPQPTEPDGAMGVVHELRRRNWR